MNGKNRYFCRSRISEAKFRQIVRHFALDLTATECAALTDVSVCSLNDIYLRIRSGMSQWCLAHSPLTGELEADESCFGARRVRGKRGRGSPRQDYRLRSAQTRRHASTRKLSPTPPKPRCKPLSGARPTSAVSSTPTAGAATTGWWTSALTSISGSTTATTSSPGESIASTASSPSGALPDGGWQSSTALPNIPSTCI